MHPVIGSKPLAGWVETDYELRLFRTQRKCLEPITKSKGLRNTNIYTLASGFLRVPFGDNNSYYIYTCVHTMSKCGIYNRYIYTDINTYIEESAFRSGEVLLYALNLEKLFFLNPAEIFREKLTPKIQLILNKFKPRLSRILFWITLCCFIKISP